MPRNIDRERKEERVRLKKRSLHELLNKEIEKSGTIIDSPRVDTRLPVCLVSAAGARPAGQGRGSQTALTCPFGVRRWCQVSRSGAG